MHPMARRIAAAAALAALIAATAGCSPGSGTAPTPSVTPVPTTSAEATAAPATPSVSTGAITTPATGTALRAAILRAASAGLASSGDLIVYQLFAQDSAAVGDVRLPKGSRIFFALVGGPDNWALTWSAPFGSSRAGAGTLRTDSPQVSPQLAASLDWKKPMPTPKPKLKSVPKPASAPTLSSFESFAKKSAVSMAGATYTGTFVVSAKIAKDSKGGWWGNAIAEPSQPGLESIGVWGRYSSGTWIGEIADFSSENADADFFPAGVLSKLRF